ncbi:ORF V: Enzymatic polyprotein [Labeo rohita]|uniref:ribonuclease H n=1 Tax=Labeo rohita TaxID=84645 RepID=A0ABQ8MH46_LABRO|nr:ORF V: Enzymatic polyprotein [Labeo rohita]
MFRRVKPLPLHRGPVVMPKQTAPPSKSGPSVSFGAPPEERMSISASEGERSADEADVSSEAEAELSAMLLRAAKEIGLEVPKVPPPDPSRLDDWFLGASAAGPFFPEVHDELVRVWRAPYLALSCSVSSPLATVDGGAAKGYTGVPQVERAVAVHLCPQDAATWRGSPRLPSKACRLSSALTGRAYCAVAQAATALHAIATLQVYQAKALKELHKGSPDQEVMQELRTATDFTARTLGQVMSMLMVQERHLWLNLAQMADVDKARFLDAPVSQAGLFGDTVKDFAQQFSAVQKQTEAIKHILPRRDTLRPTMRLSPPDVVAAARERCRPLLRGQPPRPAGLRSVPDTGSPEMVEAALRGTTTSVPPLPEEGRDLLAPGSVPERRYASSGSGSEPTFASAGTGEEGRCCPVRPDFSPGRSSFWDQSPSPSPSRRLPDRGHVGQRSVDPTCSQAGGLTRASQPVPVADPDGTSRLCDSVRQASFLRFAFEGRAYQCKVLPFGLSLSPHVFTKVAEGALNPLWRKGIRILNYLDDWLIMAHSRDLLCEHRDLVLQHLSHLGLRVNREKSKLSPAQRISFLGMELDSVNMTACLTNERTQSVLNCLKSFRHKAAVPLKIFQRLLGHMAAAAAVTPLGLLHMRPLQRWLHDRVLRWAWHRGTLRIGVSRSAGVPLGQVSRHVVVHTDASTTGWGAVCNGQAASGSWTGPRLLWHINCLELLAVLLALRRFLPMLRHKHVLVRTDNTATVAYINRQGGLRSRRMSELARHLLLWSQKRLKSLRAIHIPGELNRSADQLSRKPTHPGKWRLHPQTVQLIWSRFGEAQIDLFASPESSHCQLYYFLSEAPLWPPGPKYAFPPVSLLAQTLCKIMEDGEQVLLVAPYWPTWTWFVDLTLLATAPSLENPLEEGPSFSGDGHNLAPASRSMEPACVASGRDTVDLSGLPQAVIETITQSRAPSTRQAYALRWGLFVDWCASRGEDPQRCPIAVVLSFLQAKLERRLSPSTLKVRWSMVVRFLRGARRVNPPRPHLVPSWDLSVALQGLRGPPFEPLVSVELKFLSLKTALLTALTSIKRRAWSSGRDSHVVLRPRPGYVPKVPTTPFRDQVVNLQALPPEETDPALALLCPVRALRIYVDRTRSFRRSEQLFVCFGGQQKGNAVSKERLAHWVVDAISLAYESQGEPCPLGVRAHSTRSVASSYALAHGASLADICRAAGWATPNTFTKFYNLRVKPMSSRVLRRPAGVGLLRHSHGIRALSPSMFPPVNPGSSMPRSQD